VSQVPALADVFGVSPSWFLDRKEKPMLLNEEADGIAQYRARSLVPQRRKRLPERERKLVVRIVRLFTDRRGVSDRW
jgi:hypothetical protein